MDDRQIFGVVCQGLAPDIEVFDQSLQLRGGFLTDIHQLQQLSIRLRVLLRVVTGADEDPGRLHQFALDTMTLQGQSAQLGIGRQDRPHRGQQIGQHPAMVTPLHRRTNQQQAVVAVLGLICEVLFKQVSPLFVIPPRGRGPHQGPTGQEPGEPIVRIEPQCQFRLGRRRREISFFGQFRGLAFGVRGPSLDDAVATPISRSHHEECQQTNAQQQFSIPPNRDLVEVFELFDRLLVDKREIDLTHRRGDRLLQINRQRIRAQCFPGEGARQQASRQAESGIVEFLIRLIVGGGQGKESGV